MAIITSHGLDLRIETSKGIYYVNRYCSAESLERNLFPWGVALTIWSLERRRPVTTVLRCGSGRERERVLSELDAWYQGEN